MSSLENFFYQIKGPPEAQKWVFLHGLMGYSANWMKVISQLEESECCLVYDQRGHGRSFHPPSGHYSSNDYARDLKEITEALGWQSFILVGHSMGARNALSFTHLHPKRVQKLILEDLAVDLSQESLAYYRYLFSSVPTPFQNRESARQFFQNEFVQTVKTRESPSILAQFFYSNMKDRSNGEVDWRFSKEGILESVQEGSHKDTWPMLQSLKVPTLLIRGERSQELTRPSFQKILSLNPQIQGVEISNAGHWVHVDQPQHFTDVLKDFAAIGRRVRLT